MNFNKTFLGGNLTRDPELRHSATGMAYVKFGVAVNEKQKTVFADVTAFGRTAEVIQEHLGKGDPIFIEGRLDFSEWEDKATGAKRSKLAVTCDRFQFVGSKRDKDLGPGARCNASDDEVPF